MSSSGFWIVVLFGGLVLVGLQIVHRAMRQDEGRAKAKPHFTSTPLEGPATEDGPHDSTNGQDSWEGGFWDVENARFLRKNFHIAYTDASGQRSERDISMRAFDEGSDLLLAHCHLRGATRTFRFSRISFCVDLDTGEIIASPSRYCVEAYAITPRGATEMAIEEHYDALMIVFFVSRLDGKTTSKEADVIARFASALTGSQAITGDVMRTVLKEWGPPSLGAYRLAVGRVAKKDVKDRARLLVCARMVVLTKRKPSPEERAAISYLCDRLLPDAPAEWRQL